MRLFNVITLITLFLTGCATTEQTVSRDYNLPKQCLTNAQFDPLFQEPRRINYEWMSLDSWYQQHANQLQQTAQTINGNLDVLFIGDSITAAWPYQQWQRLANQHQIVNAAIGGDTTHNLLWRLNHGHYDKLSPKVVNILIGVNNMGLKQQTPQQAYCGILTIVDKVTSLYPNAEVVLNQLLPWGELPDSDLRQKTVDVNALLSAHSFSQRVTLVRVWDELLERNGNIDKAIMADFLHPTKVGYQRYADKLFPLIKSLIANSLPSSQQISLDHDKLHIMGRAVLQNGKAQLGFPGASVKFNSDAEQISLTAASSHGSALIDVIVNGNRVNTIAVTTELSSQVVYQNPNKQEVSIALINRSESWNAVPEIHHITLDNGQLLPYVNTTKHKLLIVGDSITCGAVSLRNAECKKEPELTSPFDSYGMKLAAKLNAEVHLICASGRGLIRAWDGKTNEPQAREYINFSILTQPNSHPWDHSQYQPDAVIVALGTNDFNPSIPTVDEYIPPYLAFIRFLNQQYPNAKIAMTAGPMVNNFDKSQPKRAELERYLSLVKSQSQVPVTVLPSQYHRGDDCDPHPTAAQHSLIAEEMYPAVKALLDQPHN